MQFPGWTGGILLTLLAVATSIGLTFASVELPALLHEALVGSVPALDGDSHGDDAARLRTELFIRHYHLRTVGYSCFALMVALIVVGFAIDRKGLAIAGAAMMFLPVFAQFATTMFFLAGLGLLNLVWLPVLDLSFDLAALGDIVYLPYRLLRWPSARLGIDIHEPLVALLIGGGLLVFIIGTLSWFVARARGRDVADFWLYRVSRHPQYLGWLIWSYGMLLALGRVAYPRRSWGISGSLPWLLAAMVIIGVALLEERRMARAFGERYARYRQRAPFLVPLPRLVSEAFTLPSRLLFGKRVPERNGEIAAVLVLFTVILIALSYVSLQVRAVPRLPASVRADSAGDTARADRYVHWLRTADTWHERAPFASALEGMDELAVDPLIAMLDEDAGPVRSAAAGALARIGSDAAVEPLIAVLGDPRPWTRAAVVNALGQLGSERAVEPLLALLRDDADDAQVRRAVMVAFAQIGSPQTESALRDAFTDDDLEVRIYAAEALKSLTAPGPPRQ